MRLTGFLPSAFQVLESAVWIGVFALAFIMQVIPFLLILTLTTMAFGISSKVALVMIPVALFSTIFLACQIMARRKRAMLPDPQFMRPPQARTAEDALVSPQARLAETMRRQRFY